MLGLFGRSSWNGNSVGAGVGTIWTTFVPRFCNVKNANMPHTSNSNTAPEAISHGSVRLRSPIGRTTVVSPAGTVCCLAIVLVATADSLGTATVLAAAVGNNTVCASPRLTTVDA
jgi:hypothetical protein